MTSDRPSMNGQRRPPPAVAPDATPVTQRGNRVRIRCGEHEGRTGLVVGIHLAHGDGQVIRRAVVLLDATRQAGIKLRRFSEGQLRVID